MPNLATRWFGVDMTNKRDPRPEEKTPVATMLDDALASGIKRGLANAARNHEETMKRGATAAAEVDTNVVLRIGKSSSVSSAFWRVHHAANRWQPVLVCAQAIATAIACAVYVGTR